MERYNLLLSTYVHGKVHVEQQMINSELLKFKICLLKREKKNTLLQTKKELSNLAKDLDFSFHKSTPYLYGMFVF